MAVARVGGRLLGQSCRHCGIRATRGNAPDCRGGQLPQDRGRGPQAPVAAPTGSGTSPVGRAGVVGASEMATGVVVGSAVILAPASSPPLGPKNDKQHLT